MSLSYHKFLNNSTADYAQQCEYFMNYWLYRQDGFGIYLVYVNLCEVSAINKLTSIRNYFKDNPKALGVLLFSITVLATLASIALIWSIAYTERLERGPDPLPNKLFVLPGDAATATPPAVQEKPPATGENPKSNTLRLTLSDSDASALLADSFRAVLPLEDSSVSFFAPDRIRISGKVNKSDLNTLIPENQSSLLHTAMQLAPDTLALRLQFFVQVEDGRLLLEPESLLVNKINLTMLVPEDAVERAAEQLVSLLPGGVSIQSLEVRNGEAEFTLVEQSDT